MGRPIRIFTQEEINDIVKFYQDKRTTRQIAKYFKVGEPRIIEILKENNIKLRGKGELNKRYFTNSEKQNILLMYKKGYTIREIIKAFKTSGKKISELLKQNNFDLNKQRKYFCNFDFFEEINTEEKAYWLGFMFADGWINDKSVIGFGLKTEDKYHLETFLKHIESNYSIYDDKNHNFSSIHICSGKMNKDLCNKGCIPKKSLIIKPPNNLPQNLCRHFIRGYFDGDGSIGFYPQYSKTNVSILGTEQLLKWIANELINYGIDSITVKPRNKIFELYIYRKKNFKLFYDYLYQDSTVKLERKYNIFNDVLKHYNFD